MKNTRLFSWNSIWLEFCTGPTWSLCPAGRYSCPVFQVAVEAISSFPKELYNRDIETNTPIALLANFLVGYRSLIPIYPSAYVRNDGYVQKIIT